MMNNIQFSIGILSWKGYDSLTNSLLSYQKNGLSKLTKNKFICLPEFSEEGIKIAKKINLYGYKNTDLGRFNLANVELLIKKNLLQKNLIKPLYIS